MREPNAGTVVRPAVCAGSWYPADPDALRTALDAYLAGADPIADPVRAVLAPHAGLMYSGAIAGRAYGAVSRQHYDVVVLVGPSHFHRFEGVAVWGQGSFATPLGALTVESALAADLRAATPIVRESPGVHEREHSLELQLPFLARIFPTVPILPLLVGHQHAATAAALGDALARVLHGREPLLVASSDLSHYQDRHTAARLDAVVVGHVERNDPDGLQASLAADPSHACGGGPLVAVMRGARGLRATHARVLGYGDSGDVTGDTRQVVGYLSAAFGEFGDPADARPA
jgi:AmmeMemoRadiSam system protein B